MRSSALRSPQMYDASSSESHAADLASAATLELAYAATQRLDSDNPNVLFMGPYSANAGNVGSLPRSPGSCWMITVARRFFSMDLKRSSDASVWARSKLKMGTPLLA